MPEPMGVYSSRRVVFDMQLSTRQNIIMSQGRFALQAVVQAIDELVTAVNASKITNAFVDPKMMILIDQILNYQGMASTFLFNGGKRGRQESKAAFDLRLERIDYVRKKCTGLKISYLTDRKLRNALVHFDEYAADEMLAAATGWHVDSAMLFRDDFSHPEIPNMKFARVYIASEHKLLHFDSEMSVSELRRECSEIAYAVFGTPQTEPVKRSSRISQAFLTRR